MRFGPKYRATFREFSRYLVKIMSFRLSRKKVRSLDRWPIGRLGADESLAQTVTDGPADSCTIGHGPVTDSLVDVAADFDCRIVAGLLKRNGNQ